MLTTKSMTEKTIMSKLDSTYCNMFYPLFCSQRPSEHFFGVTATATLPLYHPRWLYNFEYLCPIMFLYYYNASTKHGIIMLTRFIRTLVNEKKEMPGKKNDRDLMNVTYMFYFWRPSTMVAVAAEAAAAAASMTSITMMMMTTTIATATNKKVKE